VRISAPLLTVVGTVAGTAAAVVAYQATAAGPPATKPASVSSDTPVPTSTSWLPCERGWKVDGSTCVRVKKKVVVVHDLPAQAAAPAGTAGVRSSSAGASGHDGARDDDGPEAEDAGEDERDDSAEDQSEDAAEPATEDSGHEDVGDDD
jgi:hypothetical protein